MRRDAGRFARVGAEQAGDDARPTVGTCWFDHDGMAILISFWPTRPACPTRCGAMMGQLLDRRRRHWPWFQSWPGPRSLCRRSDAWHGQGGARFCTRRAQGSWLDGRSREDQNDLEDSRRADRDRPRGPTPFAQAQPEIPSYSMPSTHMFETNSDGGETYRIFVSYPKGEAPEGGCPVLYVIDRKAYFSSFAETRRLLEYADRGKDLVVGVGYLTMTPMTRAEQAISSFRYRRSVRPRRRNHSPKPLMPVATSSSIF